MEKYNVEFMCPYCGRLNRTMVKLGSVEPRFEVCDIDQGGCDRYVVFRPHWDIRASAIVGPVPWLKVDTDDEDEIFWCPTCGKNQVKYGETCDDCLQAIE